MNDIVISIGVVALNEQNYLPRLFNDFNNQEYSHSLIEILLIDGGSTDNTKEIMNNFAQANEGGFKSIRVLDNPGKIQAAGWNVAIDNYSGDVLTRIDAHASIPSNFTALVAEDIASGDKVVGGDRPCISEDKTAWGKMLLSVENSLFGSSFGRKKSQAEKEPVDTLFHLSYSREVIDKVGHFNEKLLRTEDNEFHYRIRKAGYKIMCDPRITSNQYSRSTFKKMTKQKWANGLWVGITSRVCPACISPFHYVPMAFVIALLIALASLCLTVWLPIVTMLSLYAVFAIFSAIMIVRQDGFTPYIFLVPFIFLILHVAYGAGTIVGLIKGLK